MKRRERELRAASDRTATFSQTRHFQYTGATMLAQKGPSLQFHSAAGASLTWDCTSDPSAGEFELAGAGNDRESSRRGGTRDPLEVLADLSNKLAAGSQPAARCMGFVSYDFGRQFEEIPSVAVDAGRLPLLGFARGMPGAGQPVRPTTTAPYIGGDITSNFTRRQYLEAVARVVEYIRAGDVFQVNLSQRFTAPLTAPVEEIYARLRASTPAAYGALLDFGSFALVCNSPELFFRVTPLPEGRRKIITRPIKGTRPLAPGMAAQLRDSIKDQAELNMIIDLERNDLGRICEIGSVKVTQSRTIEAHPTVYHGVATIEGILRDDAGPVDIFRSMFPGGSVTGAPKIRAMQIIEEIEPVRRGPYCGAIGYLAADGSMEFNIAIRTMIIENGLVHIPVGGGIVADSDPAEEYEETLVKARAMFAALGVGVKV